MDTKHNGIQKIIGSKLKEIDNTIYPECSLTDCNGSSVCGKYEIEINQYNQEKLGTFWPGNVLEENQKNYTLRSDSGERYKIEIIHKGSNHYKFRVLNSVV